MMLLLKILVGINILLFKYPKMLFKDMKKISTIDKVVLQSIKENMSTEQADILDFQLSQFNYIEHITIENTETAFSKIEGFQYSISLKKIFHFTEEEVEAGQVKLELNGIRIKAKVFIVRGMLYSIEYDKDIRENLESGNSKITVLHAELTGINNNQGA